MPEPDKKYAITVEEVIANTLKGGLGSIFKNYLVGRIDTPTINNSMMPCILISRFSSSAKAQTTATDALNYTIAISLIMSRKDGFVGIHGEESNSLYMNNLIDGLDPVTGEYSGQSILGILRKKFSLPQSSADGLTIRGTIDDELAEVNYPVTRLRDTVNTMEATIKLTVQKHVVVTVRT